MPSSAFLSFCRYFPLQKEKQAVPRPRPPPPPQTMLCCCSATCIWETTTKSTLVMVGEMGRSRLFFELLFIRRLCLTNFVADSLYVAAIPLFFQFKFSFLSFWPYPTLVALFIMVFGMVHDIFFIPSFQKAFFVRF